MKPGPVLLAVGAVVVLAVGVYALSDVHSAKVDTAVQDFTTWTPENIAKSPKAYLVFCERKVDQAIGGLKAKEIAVHQALAKVQGLRETAANKVTVGETALRELQGLYRADTWPVEWRDGKRNRDWVRRQLVSLHKEVVDQQGIVERCQRGEKSLQAQQVRIQELRAEAQRKKSEIAVARQQIAIDAINDEMQDTLVDLKGALSVLTTSVIDQDVGVITIDQLATASVGEVSDEELDAALSY